MLRFLGEIEASEKSKKFGGVKIKQWRKINLLTPCV
jgi:hypothetical protein